jgi:hypothetical protein
MPNNVSCGSEEQHNSHYFQATVHYHCSGTVECGKVEHEPHMFVLEDVKVRCAGICLCGSPQQDNPHSPGEHK